MSNIYNSKNQRKSRQSISEAISISLGLQKQDYQQDNDGLWHAQDNQNEHTPSLPFGHVNNNYLGRSYVSGFLSASPYGSNSLESDILPISRLRAKSIHASQNLHKQTAKLSNDFNDPMLDDKSIEDYDGLLGESPSGEYSFSLGDDTGRGTEISDEEHNANGPVDEYESLVSGPGPHYHAVSSASDIEAATPSTSPFFWSQLVSYSYKSIHYIPAAILGLLLNILDGLSYGMIIFPITEPVFSHLGPTGLTMFYISTIISQITYSSGFSGFTSGIGSEMIEVTPFFHTMALAIKDSLPGKDDEIITTTLFCYVVSSLVTGAAFYSLGKLRLGKIVGFFPRHILIGCIGGVGYFLVVTGLEVTTRVAKVEYTWSFISHLFLDIDTLLKWLLPVLLTVILVVTQGYFQNSLVLPSFYIATLVVFHFFVAIIPNVSLDKLRDIGWIFPLAKSNDKWYDYYHLFNFQKVHWSLVLKQIPTMLALTFFGILHVPINVPALAISLHMDKYDVDKELIAHGYSNFLSGALGSIQNYLVYTNSVLFIRAGADSPIAGFMLAALTFAIMAIGPVVVSFIPICIVGSLIFLLGYELIYEALVETLGKVTTFEYITIMIIVFTMGIFDFVLGVIVGILIACFSFLVESTKLQTVNGEFDGKVAKSTVYRDYVQSNFLNGVGEQTYVLKLQNILFFGTIISIEEKINKLLEISDNKNSTKRRIKYLILDFKNINADNIDYSAAEGFNRIKRFTESKRIQLIISSIKERDHIYNAFSKVGLLDDVELFGDLNSALEWCENEFLCQYKVLRAKARDRLQKKMNVTSAIMSASKNKDLNGPSKKESTVTPRSLMSLPLNTPRNHQMLSVAQNVFRNEEQTVNNWKRQYNGQEPVLPLLLFALKSYVPTIISDDMKLRSKEIEFWSRLCPYFSRRRLATQSLLLHNNDIFFVVETGLLKIVFDLPQGVIYETLSNRTCYGKAMSVGKKSVSDQNVTIKTETDSVLWIIDTNALASLRKENLELYTELILLIMSIKDKRYKELLGYTLVSA